MDSIEDELNHMTRDQLEMLKDVSNLKDDNIEKLKEKRNKRWDTNYVDHDIEKKSKE